MKALASLLVVSLVPLGLLQAQDSLSPATSTDSLLRRIDGLEHRLKLIEERPAASATVAAGSDGFRLRSSDGSFMLELRALVAGQTRIFLGDRDRLLGNTMLLRRVRPILDVTLAQRFSLRMVTDFGDARVQLQDAFAEARWRPDFRMRFGRFKPPTGVERMQSIASVVFTERSLAASLTSNRDIGLQVQGELAGGGVQLTAGVFNGVQDNASSDGDAEDNKDLVGRLWIRPWQGQASHPLREAGLGLSASHGSPRGSVAATALGVYRTSGQQGWFTYRGDGSVAGTTVADGTRERINPQLYFAWKRVGLLAEVVQSRQEVTRDSAHATVTNRAWSMTGSLLLTRDKAAYGGVTPTRSLAPRQGWGAWEIVFRLSQVRIDADAFPLFANPAVAAARATAWSTGLNWYWNRNLKLMLDYEHASFQGGAAGADRRSEQVVAGQMQVAF
jgi:phosphate-selective porin OprO/OprP